MRSYCRAQYPQAKVGGLATLDRALQSAFNITQGAPPLPLATELPSMPGCRPNWDAWQPASMAMVRARWL